MVIFKNLHRISVMNEKKEGNVKYRSENLF